MSNSKQSGASARGKQLELAIDHDFHDLAAHAAYADWLSQQGDPRGEFIQVQLALEDASRSESDRQGLRAREKKLLAEHGRSWLGDLADELLQEPRTLEFQFARGWLEGLFIRDFTEAFAARLARNPAGRMLRRLSIVEEAFNEEEGDREQALALLRDAVYLGNLRFFQLGEQYEDSRWGGPGCHTNGESAADLVEKMPHIEELHLLAHRVPSTRLFALQSLGSLRILHLDHSYEYPLEILAANPALANLTDLLLHPHGMDHEDPYIRLRDLQSLAESKHLSRLRHLRLCCSDLGDEGCRLLVSSGLLGRLKILELTHGCITDEGARALADAPACAHLELLDLSYNALTPDGVQYLTTKCKGIAVKAAEHHNHGEIQDRVYLFEADPE